VPIIQPKIRFRQLQFKQQGFDRIETVWLPFGVGVNAKDYRFERYAEPKGTFEIRAYPKRHAENEAYVVISPSFSTTDSLRDPSTGKKLSIRLWVVYTDADRLGALQVAQRVHYLSGTDRGMILVCAFAEPQQQVELRRRAHRGRATGLNSDLSWHLPPGGIVGCAVLDTLWHGVPLQGRALIAERLGLRRGWRAWDRPQIINEMRVAWASRFAVDAPYRGLGMGKKLAMHLKTVARAYRAPRADFLEVITTSLRHSAGANDERGDFLCEAGYVKLKETMKSGCLLEMDPATGCRMPKPAVKYYYYADLRQ
jgi:GNAT superfamily N-acetyltransferase